MGKALYYEATLIDGKEHYSLLEESIQAFHKALEIYTQEHNQSAWSSTQHYLGMSLHRQASLMNGEEQVQLLNKAIQAYHAALNGLNKTDNSTEWASAYPNALRSCIKQAGYSFREVSRETTIPESTLYSWASGKQVIPHASRERLAQVIGCAVEELAPKRLGMPV